MSRVRISLVKSLIGTKKNHRLCVRALGLRRINHNVEVELTPAIKGLINKVSYLLKCEAI